MQRWACFTFWCYVKTSCCSSESEKPHRHCHLSNKVDTLTGDLIFPILTMSWRCHPQTAFFPGHLGPWFFRPQPSTQCRKHLDRSIRFCTGHGSADPRSRYICNSKVYGYSSSQSNLPHRYGNSHAIWDHTVLPATRQR